MGEDATRGLSMEYINKIKFGENFVVVNFNMFWIRSIRMIWIKIKKIKIKIYFYIGSKFCAILKN